jgi:hypothetical protein
MRVQQSLAIEKTSSSRPFKLIEAGPEFENEPGMITAFCVFSIARNARRMQEQWPTEFTAVLKPTIPLPVHAYLSMRFGSC